MNEKSSASRKKGYPSEKNHWRLHKIMTIIKRCKKNVMLIGYLCLKIICLPHKTEAE